MTALVIGMCLLTGLACRSGARSRKSFDEICSQVAGKTATQVEALLGRPDAREKLPIGDWRWIWWNYTFLDGDSYPPELRGKVVHLEIMFSNPTQSNVPDSQWRVGGPLAVSYALPQSASGAL
jgi:hypothetical protein